jgi:hypothetical protein
MARVEATAEPLVAKIEHRELRLSEMHRRYVDARPGCAANLTKHDHLL